MSAVLRMLGLLVLGVAGLASLVAGVAIGVTFGWAGIR